MPHMLMTHISTKGTCPLVTIENYFRDKAGLIEYIPGDKEFKKD